MTTAPADIAVIGLGPMGRNLALNFADHGVRVVASDSFPRVVEAARAELGAAVRVAARPQDTVADLVRPRRILLMVKAGDPVDALIELLVPLLEPGDVVVDGGNSRWNDTERRNRRLAEAGIRFVGLGVSGGEEGARHGPALMAGGDPAAIAAIAPVFGPVAAKAPDGSPCWSDCGPGAAGHFVKMAHNGIEYALMQTLAEIYLLLEGPAGLPPSAIAEVIAGWNHGVVASYLLDITATVLAAVDEETGRPMVEVIRDAAAHKGTGRWTVEAGLDLGVAVPGVAAALAARMMSQTPRGGTAPRRLAGPAPADLVADLGRALPAAMLAAYAQGLTLIAEASRVFGWSTDLAAVARGWRNGCIIRSAMLDPLAAALAADPSVADPLASRFAADVLAEAEVALRRVAGAGLALAVPVPALTAALTLLDGMRAPRLGANLIQGLRDLFGAHTFERIDRPGTFHRIWQPAAHDRGTA